MKVCEVRLGAPIERSEQGACDRLSDYIRASRWRLQISAVVGHGDMVVAAAEGLFAAAGGEKFIGSTLVGLNDEIVNCLDDYDRIS